MQRRLKTLEYKSRITNIGASKIAEAIIKGETINLVSIAAGDGGGEPYEPTGSETKLKNEVLKHCSNDCILKICEIAYNLLKGNVPLKSSQKKKLAPQKHILRRLVQPQSVQKRRRTLLLNQKGGVFPVIPLILSLLS